MKETLRTRTRRKVRQLWKEHRTYLAMGLMGIMGFLVGVNFWAFRSLARFVFNGFQIPESSARHRSSRSSANSGCDLYPDEPVCKATHQSGRENLDTSSCFVPRGSKFGENDLFGLPDECSNFGPLGDLVNLTTLRSETPPLKPIVEVPSSIRPYFEGANARLSVKSVFVTFLVVMRANGENGDEMMKVAMKESYLAPVIQELSLSSDDGLTEEERKTAGQMLGIYNAFVSVLQGQHTEQREKIAKECAGYTDRDLVPIRCAVINSPSGTPTSL